MPANRRSVTVWNQRFGSFQNSKYSSGRFSDPQIAYMRHLQEKRILFKAISIDKSMVVLDIGSGAGRWAIEFSKRVKKVYAIEPSDAFKILQENIAKCKNIDCVKVDLQSFKSEEKFDLIILSGVLMYIVDDSECEILLNKISTMLKKDGYFILRESLSRRTLCQYGRKKHRYYNQTELNNCSYFDISREKKFYKNICANSNIKLDKVFAGPVTLFEPIEIFNKSSIKKKFIRLLSRRQYRLWYLYNNLFGKIEEIVRYTINMPKMKILIFKK